VTPINSDIQKCGLRTCLGAAKAKGKKEADGTRTFNMPQKTTRVQLWGSLESRGGGKTKREKKKKAIGRKTQGKFFHRGGPDCRGGVGRGGRPRGGRG